MRISSGGWALAVLLALGLSATAYAQGDNAAKAKEHYDKALTAYNLGHFEEAIQEFEAAFKLQADPILLYNIAQAHRQAGNPDKAIFFYKRYLSLQPKAGNRVDVEKKISELEDLLKKQQETREKPPVTAQPPDNGKPPETGGGDTPNGQKVAQAGGGEVTTGGGEGGSNGGGGDVQLTTPVETRARKIRLGLNGGAMIPSFKTDVELEDAPPQVAFTLGGAYTLGFGKVALDLGALLTYSPIPWDNDDLSGTTSLIGLIPEAAARYAVMPKLDLRANLGLGVTWWAGLKEGNPFTDGAADAPVPMFTFRAGLGADYAISDSLFVGASAAFTTSAPGGDKFFVTRISHLDLLLGVGYAL